MAKTTKIEQRTRDFLKALAYLERIDKLPPNAELASILGIRSISTISEIRGLRQNIQPPAWKKFRDYFGSEISELELDNSESLLLSDTGREFGMSIDNLMKVLQIQAETIKSQQETIALLTQTQSPYTEKRPTPNVSLG